MKRTMIAAACLALLAGCSSGTAPTTSPEITPSNTTALTEEIIPTTSPESDIKETSSQVQEKSFNTTVEEVIQVLEANLKESVQVLPSDVEAGISPDEENDIRAKGTTYYYPIYEGVTLYILDSEETGKVQTVYMIIDSGKLTKEIAGDVGRYLAVLTGMFEPDDAALVLVDRELNIANSSFSEDNIYLSTGTIASFMYVISDGIAMLSIDPV